MSNLEVLKENNDYIVVNKMAGLISEKSPYENLTVENQVLHHLLKNKRKPYIGVIHRLDRVTSGVLVFAKKKVFLWNSMSCLAVEKFKKPIWQLFKRSR